jgi:hypothetical protein
MENDKILKRVSDGLDTIVELFEQFGKSQITANELEQKVERICQEDISLIKHYEAIQEEVAEAESDLEIDKD